MSDNKSLVPLVENLEFIHPNIQNLIPTRMMQIKE